MFCTKCGKELNVDAKFCDGCGAQIGVEEIKEAPKKRKKTGLIIAIIAIVLAFIIGALALIGWLAESYLQNLDTDNYDVFEDVEIDLDEITSEDDTQDVNDAYEEVFTSHNIIDSPAVFMMLDSASFVIESEDGMVEKIEFGYEDDIVKEMVNTVYYPITGLSAEEVDAIDSSMRTAFSAYEEDGFCSVSYNTLSDYFVITINFTSLDNADNVQKMADFGMLTGSDVTVISMSETESGLLSSGYIKK